MIMRTTAPDVRLLVENLQKMGFRIEWLAQRDGLLQIDGGLPDGPPSAEPVELATHVLDVGVGPCFGMHILFDCRVLRR